MSKKGGMKYIPKISFPRRWLTQEDNHNFRGSPQKCWVWAPQQALQTESYTGKTSLQTIWHWSSMGLAYWRVRGLPNKDVPLKGCMKNLSCSEWDSTVQFSSVAHSCPTLCDPMNCNTPGLPVHHQLPEFAQTCPSSWWCHPAISSSVVPFSSCPQSLPASVFSNESVRQHRDSNLRKDWVRPTCLNWRAFQIVKKLLELTLRI